MMPSSRRSSAQRVSMMTAPLSASAAAADGSSRSIVDRAASTSSLTVIRAIAGAYQGRQRRIGLPGAGYARQPMPTTTLWRHADFMKLWAGQTVSELGSVVTRTAIPLLAVLVLGAGPNEMAALVVAGSLAVLLVGFLAGAWVDRLARRPLLIWTDVIRAIVLLSIPVAFVSGVLRIEQLYLVVFLEACLGAFFDAAYPAYVPSLIGVDRVVEGNSR